MNWLDSDERFLLFGAIVIIGGGFLIGVGVLGMVAIGMWFSGVPLECLWVHCVQSAPGEITVVNR